MPCICMDEFSRQEGRIQALAGLVASSSQTIWFWLRAPGRSEKLTNIEFVEFTSMENTKNTFHQTHSAKSKIQLNLLLPVWWRCMVLPFFPDKVLDWMVSAKTKNQGILKGEVSLYHWPSVGLVWNQLYDYWQFLFLFSKQTNPNQPNRRSMVQWYFPL